MIAALVFVHWFALALGLALSDAFFDGFEIDGGALTYLGIALVFTVLNLVLGTIAKVLAIRVVMFTLGVFALVINALVLLLTDAMISSLEIDGFWPAFGTAIVVWVISVIAVVLTLVMFDRRTAVSAA